MHIDFDSFRGLSDPIFYGSLDPLLGLAGANFDQAQAMYSRIVQLYTSLNCTREQAASHLGRVRVLAGEWAVAKLITPSELATIRSWQLPAASSVVGVPGANAVCPAELDIVPDTMLDAFLPQTAGPGMWDAVFSSLGLDDWVASTAAKLGTTPAQFKSWVGRAVVALVGAGVLYKVLK